MYHQFLAAYILVPFMLSIGATVSAAGISPPHLRLQCCTCLHPSTKQHYGCVTARLLLRQFAPGFVDVHPAPSRVGVMAA